jgi:hypothetical protein
MLSSLTWKSQMPRSTTAISPVVVAGTASHPRPRYLVFPVRGASLVIGFAAWIAVNVLPVAGPPWNVAWTR